MTRWSWLFGFAGALSVLASFALWYVLGDVAGPPRMFAFGGAVSLMAWLALDRERVGDTVASRAFTYGGTATLMTGMVATLAGGLYVIARDHDQTWDWTGSGAFTLSEHTRTVCDGMEADVEILAFYPARTIPERTFRDLARALEPVCPRVTTTLVDPISRPGLAREHEVRAETGVLVLTASTGQTRRLEGRLDEEKLTDALVVLLADKEHVLCWAQGHGEASPDDEMSERGLGRIAFDIDDMNYRIEKIFPGAEGIPRTCDALVLASPELDWQPAARESLAAYLGAGGRVLALMEPDWAPELAADFGRYGVQLRQDIVLDLNPKNQLLGIDEPSFVVLTDDNLRPHPITASLNASIVLGIARSVSVDVNAGGVSARQILVTSDQAWGETHLMGDVVEPNDDELQGEVPLMAVVEVVDPAQLEVAAPIPPGTVQAGEGALTSAGAGVPADYEPIPGGRLVVIGDADFANNRFIDLGNNRDLFLNAIAWLVDEVDQLGERPESGDTLELTELQGAVLVLVSVFGMPGLAVLVAVLTLLRRRRL